MNNPDDVTMVEVDLTGENYSDHGILNPYTGIIERPLDYPHTDLDNDSEEECVEQKEKKRVWKETDSKDWLRIYQEYMQKRLETQPQPLCFKVGRTSLKHIGKTGRNLRRASSEESIPNILESDNLDCTRTVNDLKLEEYLARQGDEGEIAGDPEYGNAIHLEQCLSQKTKNDLEPNNMVGLESIDDFSREAELSDSDKRGKTIKQKIFKKMNLENLQCNTLKLLKYSNICLFKWPKCYFVCYECLHRFKYMQSLRFHVQESHNYNQLSRKIVKENYTFPKADLSDLECKICRKVLDSLSELQNHLIEHGITFKSGGSSLIPFKLCSDTFICQLCQDEFTNRYRLQKHMDNHFFSHICPECNVGFRNSKSLEKHSQAHSKDRDTISRAIPKKVYVKRRRKLKSSNNTEEARFNCNQCSKKFKYEYNRLQHVIEEHDGESKLFQCEFCPKIFMTVHWLTKHMNCVHQEELYK